MNAIVKSENTISLDPSALLSKAIENNVPVETMERLLAMRKDIKEEQAREAYYGSLSAFQKDCPIIKKTKKVMVKGVERYRYAPLEEIIKQVGPILQKHGLSYTFKTLTENNQVSVCCVAHHEFGHSEESCFVIPIDPDAFMSDAQKAGSAATFAKRYAFCNVFGISTGDEDDDGEAVGRQAEASDLYRRFAFQMRTVMDNIETVLTVKNALLDNNLDQAAEAWAEINDYNVLKGLYVAPTKGGCFTVEERKQMESEEFKKHYSRYRDGKIMENV